VSKKEPSIRISETLYLKITRILLMFLLKKHNTTETRPEGSSPKE
jgi:hypothetical protein